MTKSRGAKAASSKTSARSSQTKRARKPAKTRGKGPAPPRTIPELLEQQAKAQGAAAALLAPGRAPLTYAGLAEHVADAASALRRFGIKKSDCIAVVLAGGADAASAFLAAAGAGIAAPLNPQYIEGEFVSYFAALKPRAVILDEGAEAARAAAAAKRIPVITLRSLRPAGAFTLEMPKSRAKPAAKGAVKPADTALVLFTSGTTAKPKLVPLSHANLMASAHAVAKSLALSPADRGLCVMPLFHIHGLVAALLAAIASGGSIAIPPGFHAIEFFAQLESFKPSWFTAVPSMHQALLARAGDHREAIAAAKLRFIRSSSAALPPTVLAALEKTFAAPVIEAYGMTEAAHQMASNPLPPRPRKAGTVGLPAGPEIAILDAKGKQLKAGQEGEVAVRGPNVTKGYVGDAKANRAAFTKGWFRTGDLGVFDQDGYLRLVSRIKEIINRGGEKIAPREVEDVLLAHEAVAEAAVFPVPDAALGEEIGAAVVLREGAQIKPADLARYAAQHLAHFKLPRHVLFVRAIPKSATGKVQRAQLASRLKLGRSPAKAAETGAGAPPRNELESVLAAIWREVLRTKTVGVDTPFLSLGGDSILAAQLVARLRARLRLDLTMADIWDTPTVAAQAARIAEIAASRPRAARQIPKRSEEVLSFGQEWWLWLESQSNIRAASNRGSSVLLKGPLDTQALAQAFAAVVARHESLRTAFAGGPGSFRPVVNAPAPLKLNFSSFKDTSLDEAEKRAHQIGREVARRPLALDRFPLWRAGLLQLGADTHVLLFIVDHTLFDGWSMAVFVRDLAAFYDSIVKKAPQRPPPLSVQYGDIAAWQRAQFTGERRAALEAYWKKKLKGARPPRLPFAKPHPAPPALRGGYIGARLHSRAGDALKGLARAEGATLYMAALAVFHALLARYAGTDDILTGSLAAGRDQLAAENQIGLFFNVLPMRGDVSGDPSPRQLLARTRALVVEAFAHQDMPIQKTAELLGAAPKAGESRVPLVPILFQMRNLPLAKARAAGVEFSEFKTPGEFATFDITFDLRETAEGLACELAFNADAYEMSDAKKLLEDFAALAAAFAANADTPLSKLPLAAPKKEKGR